jgi:uncharacterized membrane protein
MTARSLSALAILMTGAIFGFFYAWVCSTMWGLDLADPRTAMDAMKAMNASVRNIVFFPAFFLTPVALAAAAVAWLVCRQRRSAALFALAAAIYLLFGLTLTATVNVPMNEALAATPTPAGVEDARQIWSNYSQSWQFWNVVRTLASGTSLLLGTLGLMAASRPE